MTTKKSYNIGILSDSPFLSTGYSDQAKSLANMLVDNGHTVNYFAHAYVGQNVKPGVTFEDDRKLNFKIIGSGREAYFKDLIERYVKEYKLDVLVILLDTFMLFPWFLHMDLSPAKTIFWFPSDGGAGMPTGCEQILRKIDAPVAMAKFGQLQNKKCHNVDTLHIPHSVDVKNYTPATTEERNELRKKWGLQDKFVIGTVARNQGRKMLDRTIKMMARYVKGYRECICGCTRDYDVKDCPHKGKDIPKMKKMLKFLGITKEIKHEDVDSVVPNPDAVLLMHCDPNDPAQVFSISDLIARYKIQNRVVFTGTTYFKGFDYRKMKDVYNVMDVFLLSTSGEGFGVPIIEAMACKIPVLVTNYTTTKELVLDHKAGLGIDLVGTTKEENPDVHGYEVLDGTLTGSWAVERGLCSIKDGVEKLDYMFNNPELRKEMGENGRKAVLETYDWEVTKIQWLDLINKLGASY